jgi:hypothetical protein
MSTSVKPVVEEFAWDCAALCMAINVPRLPGPINQDEANRRFIGGALKNMKAWV